MRHEYHIFEPGSTEAVAQIVRVAEPLPHLTAGTFIRGSAEGAADRCWEILFVEAQVAAFEPQRLTPDVFRVNVYTAERDRSELIRGLPASSTPGR